MILISNSTAQTLTPGQAITFDTVLLKSGDGECCHNNAARTLTFAKLRKCGFYDILYQANIAVTTAAVGQLSIQIDGVTLPETTTTFIPAAANTDFASVNRETVVFNTCNEVSTVTVVNTGTTNVVVNPNATLLIRRISGGAA